MNIYDELFIYRNIWSTKSHNRIIIPNTTLANFLGMLIQFVHKALVMQDYTSETIMTLLNTIKSFIVNVKSIQELPNMDV